MKPTSTLTKRRRLREALICQRRQVTQAITAVAAIQKALEQAAKDKEQ